jgi:hypothetical protein
VDERKRIEKMRESESKITCPQIVVQLRCRIWKFFKHIRIAEQPNY